jgi:hypothetical protein
MFLQGRKGPEKASPLFPLKSTCDIEEEPPKPSRKKTLAQKSMVKSRIHP